uniref:Uncharacterized protein n=1 Tax=Plectus sambesii TaxID=2011161 RepID=A0A914UM26_9BILA
MKRGRLKKNDEKKKQGDIASTMKYLPPPNTSTPTKSLDRNISVVLLLMLSTLITAHAQELKSFTEKVDFEMPLLKMSLMGDRLATVSFDKIHLLQMAQSGLKEIQSGSVPKTGKDPKAPSDFKLLDNNRVLICYEDGCFIGDISETPTWIEYPFPSDLSPAAGVSALYTETGVLNARVVGSAKSSILRFGEDKRVIERADDVNEATDLKTVLAFEHGSHFYFLGSAKRPLQPDIVAELISPEAPHKSAMRLTRICNDGGVSETLSRFDLTLACGEDKENLEEYTASTATYDVKNDRIVLLAQQDDANGVSKEDKICSFQLADLQRAFDYALNTCQNTSQDLSSLCKYWKKRTGHESNMPHCPVFVHFDDSDRLPTTCNIDLLSKWRLGNCALAKSKTPSSHYAWLEQFQPFVGVVLARLPHVNHRKAVSFALDDSNAAFVQYDDGSLKRVLLDEKANTAAVSEQLWNTSQPRAHRQSIAVASNRLVYLNDTRVQSIPLTCASLYLTCEMVENKSDREPLGCGWCARSDGTGFSISKADNIDGDCVNKLSDDGAGVFLVSACPPHIDEV